ncbi:MAG: CAP domain-containing protein, partial [Anaerolineales bacterium]
MKKWMVSFFFLIVLSLGITSPASADIKDENIPTAIEIIRLINEFRVENGLYPYTFNYTLSLAAQDHSEWQAENRVVQHNEENGTDDGYSATPEVAMDFWIHSPVHYPLVVSEVYHEIGVGVAINEFGQKYYTVNIGMIPGITSPGPSDYRAPTVEEYKGGESVPIRLAEPQDDGAIYHIYVKGQTMAAIAEAYGISLDELLLLNDLAPNSTPPDGSLLLIQQPTGEPIIVATVTPNYTAFPTPTPRTTATSTPMVEPT